MRRRPKINDEHKHERILAIFHIRLIRIITIIISLRF